MISDRRRWRRRTRRGFSASLASLRQPDREGQNLRTHTSECFSRPSRKELGVACSEVSPDRESSRRIDRGEPMRKFRPFHRYNRPIRLSQASKSHGVRLISVRMSRFLFYKKILDGKFPSHSLLNNQKSFVLKQRKLEPARNFAFELENSLPIIA